MGMSSPKRHVLTSWALPCDQEFLAPLQRSTFALHTAAGISPNGASQGSPPQGGGGGGGNAP